MTTEFTDDRDALDQLQRHGIREIGNGVIRGEWAKLDEDCRGAVRYLCDEWDFVFEEVAQ